MHGAAVGRDLYQPISSYPIPYFRASYFSHIASIGQFPHSAPSSNILRGSHMILVSLFVSHQTSKSSSIVIFIMSFVLFVSLFNSVALLVIHLVNYARLVGQILPRGGARPRGRAFRSRVCEVLSFVHQGFVHHIRVLGVVIPPRFYCTAVSRGHFQKISSMSLPCWQRID